MDSLIYALDIHSRTDEDLDKRWTELFDYLLSKNVDPEKMIEFTCITMETTIRGYNKV